MTDQDFQKKIDLLRADFGALISRKNVKLKSEHNLYNRYQYPIITPAHIPLEWRFDFDPDKNPHFLQRLGVNATFNSGAIKMGGKYILALRIEGWDRKSFFAIAESPNGIDNFKFWEYPVSLPQTSIPDVNVYDMRLTKHEDGWIYGVFCTERKDPDAHEGDTSSATAEAGIVRTKDLIKWERLPDLRSSSPQQRNVVLHPEFVDNKYAFYTRPQDGFIDTGGGKGIGWGLTDSIEEPVVVDEMIIEEKRYHTINELKNGQGPAPLKTGEGWLHLAHGVRNTAAGLRYVLYMFMTELDQPWKIKYRPGGYFIAPQNEERVGDVSNVLFSSGWIDDEDGTVYIYYASSDTRMHVATSKIEILVDYVKNTPEDALLSHLSVEQRVRLIKNNRKKRF